MRRIGGRFEVLTQVSRGGMGIIYRARDTTTGATVAVKVIGSLEHDSEQRFAREVAILADLAHPAIVRHVAHGKTDDGAPYLVMDWVEGETLHARLERRGLTIAETLLLGHRLADALGHAHARGVVHRDLKPGNVLLGGDELARATLVDFGVARAVTATTTMTSTGALIGTPAYMSPEQARGHRDVDARADVFGLGCVLYECLTGRRAFEGRHLLALLAKVTMWQPPRPRELVPAVPPELDALLDEMIAKDPLVRPPNGAAVAERLARIAVAAPHEAPRRPVAASPPTVTTPRPAARRMSSVVVAASAAGADGTGALLDAAQLVEHRRALVEVAGMPGVALEILREGTIVAVVEGEALHGVAERAIACARAIHAKFPALLVAVTTGEIGEGAVVSKSAETLLEPTFKAIAREAMAAAFAQLAAPGRPAGAIRLDEATARVLDPGAVVRASGVAYLAST